MFKRAQRLRDVQGFGIDRTAVAADARTAAARDDWPVLRMENLDTDLPLPPEAIPATVRGLETPEANSSASRRAVATSWKSKYGNRRTSRAGTIRPRRCQRRITATGTSISRSSGSSSVVAGAFAASAPPTVAWKLASPPVPEGAR